jgi:hypothetical protein
LHLFTQLLNLHAQKRPTENFFTEIITYFFYKNSDILRTWLKSISVQIEDDSKVIVSSQLFFDSVNFQSADSQPDITIEISTGDYKDVVFLESKIGSFEGSGQLDKYAITLLSLQDIRNRYLLYITRDYEPKIKSEYFLETVNFLQLRWHDFYHFLQPFKNSLLVSEILDFMKGNGMASNNQFSSVDVLAMVNFRRTLILMDACMGEEVRDKMVQVFGNAGSGLGQFRSQGRYMVYHPFYKNWDFWCSYGFFGMDSENYLDYPTIEFVFQVSNRKFEQRANIIKAMGKFVKEKTYWVADGLQDLNAWSTIYISKSLKEIISQEDHIKTVKNTFISFLKDAEHFKKSYPDLPWENPPAETESKF